MAWLSEVCRLCLSQDRAMVPIFNEDYYKQLATCLHTKISSVADLQMSPGDGLPVLACDECCRQVDLSYEFRLRCHQSDTQLRQFVDDPPLEIMNAPDVKQEIEIVENGFDMGFPEEVDINEEGSSNESETEELQSPDPLDVDPLSGSTIRLKSEFGLLAPQNQSEDSRGEGSTTQDDCAAGKEGKANHKRSRKQNLSKVNEASFLHDTDPSYMLALDESSGVPLVNSVDETSESQKEPEFNCFICPARYLKKSYFLNHLKKHVKNNQHDNEADPEVNERLHVNINSLCEVDDDGESKKKEIMANFVCEICNSPYTLQRNYLKHLKFIHSIDKPQAQKDVADVEAGDEFSDDVPHSECIERLKVIIEIDPQLDSQISTCTICKTTFPTLTTLVDHNLGSHSTKEISKCSFCKRNFFTLISFMKHFKVHTLAKKFNCLECRAKFVTEHHLKLHVTVTHNRGCPVCGKPLKRKSDLSLHLKTHDPPRPEGAVVKKPRRKSIANIELEKQPEPAEVPVSESVALEEEEPVASTSSEKPRSRMSKIEGNLKTKNYFSQVYQTCLRKQHALKNTPKPKSPGKKKKIKKEHGHHKSTASKEITKIVFGHKIKAHKEITKKKRDRDRKIIKMQKNRPKMIKTEKNKATIKMGPSDIKKAKLKMGHSGIKKDKLKIGSSGIKKTVKMGPSQVKKPAYLREVSLENVARGEENIRIAKLSGKNECLFCTKQFMGISKLKRHILIHTGERPFECEVCDRRFNQKPSLKMHIIVCHTDHKPFPCSQCTQAFSRQNMLLNHLEKHHNV